MIQFLRIAPNTGAKEDRDRAPLKICGKESELNIANLMPDDPPLRVRMTELMDKSPFRLILKSH